KFTLKGYGESTVELVPNRPLIEYTETLHRGRTRPNRITRVPDPTLKKPDGAPPSDTAVTRPGDPAVTRPADTAVTKPGDPTPGTTKPADPKPADAKPTDPTKPQDKPK